MRNFVPTKNNNYKLPHNTYMQMFYLLRDYDRIKSDVVFERENKVTKEKTAIYEAVKKVVSFLEDEYQQRPVSYGTLDAYKAFFDYGYFSYMFAKRHSDFGASKSSWGMFRSKFAYLIADALSII